MCVLLIGVRIDLFKTNVKVKRHKGTQTRHHRPYYIIYITRSIHPSNYIILYYIIYENHHVERLPEIVHERVPY